MLLGYVHEHVQFHDARSRDVLSRQAVWQLCTCCGVSPDACSEKAIQISEFVPQPSGVRRYPERVYMVNVCPSCPGVVHFEVDKMCP